MVIFINERCCIYYMKYIKCTSMYMRIYNIHKNASICKYDFIPHTHTHTHKHIQSLYIPISPCKQDCDTRSIFKLSLTGLKSEFSFSEIGWNQSALLFSHSWRVNNWIHTFTKGISVVWNTRPDLNSVRHIHFERR